MRRFGCGKWACAIAVLIPVAVCLPVQAAVLPTSAGGAIITPVRHAHVQIEFAGKVIQVDPWNIAPSAMLKPEIGRAHV